MGLQHTGFDTRPPSKNPPAPLSCSLWFSSNLNLKKKKLHPDPDVHRLQFHVFLRGVSRRCVVGAFPFFLRSFFFYSLWQSKICKENRLFVFPTLPLTAPLCISSHPSLHLLPWPRPGCHSVRLRICFQGYCAHYRCRLVALVSLGSLNFLKKQKQKESLSFWSFYDFPVAPLSSTVSWTWGCTGVCGAFNRRM